MNSIMSHLASIYNEHREISTIISVYRKVTNFFCISTFSDDFFNHLYCKHAETATCHTFQLWFLILSFFCFQFLFSICQAKAMMKTKMVKRIDSKQRETTYTGQCHSANVLQYYWSMRLLQALSRIRKF